MGDDTTITNTEFGKIINHPDGSTEVDTPYINARMSPDGSVTTELKGTINAITLENIVHVQSYRIMRLNELTVHTIEFNDGGKVDLRYTDDGALVHFGGNRIGLQVSPEGVVTLRRFTKS